MRIHIDQECLVPAVIAATLLVGPDAMLMIKRHVQSLIDKGAYTKAIGAAAEYVRRNPDCATGHQLVAMAEEAAGYTKAAIQTVSHAIDLVPNEPSIRIMRARLLLKDHRLKEAIADVNVLIAMGDARRDKQLLHEAISCRDELLERMSLNRVDRKPQQTTSTCSQLVV